MNSLRSFDIKFLKGIGPRRADLLRDELGIKSGADLVRHYPTSYLDRSKIYTIAELSDEMPCVQIKGRFIRLNMMGEGARMRLVGLFTDGRSRMEVVWFQRARAIRDSLSIDTEYIIFGKPSTFNGVRQMTHPEVDRPEAVSAMGSFRGVYPLTDRLRNNSITSRQIHTWITNLIKSRRSIEETLPRSVIESLRLMPLGEAIANVHNPTDNDALRRARERLKFEELFYIQLDMVMRSGHRKRASTGHRLTRVGEMFNRFYNECLPFELTSAQKRVIKEIRADMNTGRQMNRLVQGDVGSGKTLVALMSMLIAVDNGLQCCLMAPTEILAGQHYETISKMVEPIGVKVALLTGSTKTAARREIHAALTDGSLSILIGTHAVIEDTVEFKNLGLAVIDEQHRFGVAQRARLWKKNTVSPHILVMTATPIPRTLAMTVYGDLDVSVIDTLPPGRKPVQTLLRYDDKRMDIYRSVHRQISMGRQVYIVYPLIEENEKVNARSLQEGYEIVRSTFPQFRIAYVHGRMKPVEKDHQMELFASHQADILVATTVIEVGVNVPNASVMIIENAERFGLSQLHQLRGRVGRGADQSYCILMTKREIARDTRKRLELMTTTTDGFVIAEADMTMRGPGDIEGTMQSGIPFDLHIANLATDGQIIQLARNAAEELLERDPELTSPDNAIARSELAAALNRTADWSRIS